jgi:outer membrane protein TolC
VRVLSPEFLKEEQIVSTNCHTYLRWIAVILVLCVPTARRIPAQSAGNNITGLLLPQSVISPITGPVRTSTTNQTAWGSAAGLLFSWEPFDFGYRGAKVDAARAAGDRAKAEAFLTRLDVAVATVNSYLTVLAAEQTVHPAEEDVQRRETFDKSVHALVDNQLRAGADASRADAELARARVNLARARQQEQISRAALADILGLPDISVEVREGLS